MHLAHHFRELVYFVAFAKKTSVHMNGIILVLFKYVRNIKEGTRRVSSCRDAFKELIVAFVSCISYRQHDFVAIHLKVGVSVRGNELG